MWFWNILVFIIAFFDTIDLFLDGLPPWLIMVLTLILFQTCHIISGKARIRLGYGMTYRKLLAGHILRFLRTFVPWVRK